MDSDICQDNYVTVFTLDNPCYYYTCTPRYNFNWKKVAIVFISVNIVLVIGFLSLIVFLPKGPSTNDVSSVGEGGGSKNWQFGAIFKV